MKEHYPAVPVYVMANGVQEDQARFTDSLRVYYLYNYINEALKGETTNAQATAHCYICRSWLRVHTVCDPPEATEVSPPPLAPAELNH